MKKELSPGLTAVLVIAAVVLLLGGGFLLYNRTSTDERPSKDEEVARFEAAKSYYQGIGVGKTNGGAPAAGGPPVSPEWEARQKMQQQQTSGGQ
jgi:hypothetical protein